MSSKLLNKSKKANPYTSDKIGVNGDLFAAFDLDAQEPAEAELMGQVARERVSSYSPATPNGNTSGREAPEQPVAFNLAEHSDVDTTEPESIQVTSIQTEQLQGLLSKHVWRSSDLLQHRHDNLDTGFAALNEAIGGWPLGATTELGLSQDGIGELRLLMPALQSRSAEPLASRGPSANKTSKAAIASKRCLWIAPPHQPYAPALLKLGIDFEQVAVVQTRSLIDTLWAAEQALLSESCAAVFTWTGRHNLTQRQTRRLQLAAEKTKSWHVLFRYTDMLQQASASSLRLKLIADDYSHLRVQVVKQPQSWGGQECVSSLPPHYERWQRLPVQLLPHANRQYGAPQQQLRILAKAAHISKHLDNLNDSDNVITLKRVS